MTINEEQKFMERVDKKIREGADIIYQNIDNVENNILDLLRIAPCVFSKDMMISLLLDFQLLDRQSGNFETVYSQISNPVTMSEAIMLDTIMKKLDELLTRLVGYITTCNSMIEAKQFSPQKALLLEKLEDNFNYDVVDWDDLDHAFDNPYLVAKVSDVLDEDYDQNYYPLHCLRLEGFKDKVSAYKYMLANGISKENLILRW